MESVTKEFEVEVSKPRSAEVRRGLRASAPVMLGFVPFALVLGARATQKGMSAFEVALMTGLNFGGGSEFAAIRLWTSPPHILLIVARPQSLISWRIFGVVRACG